MNEADTTRALLALAGGRRNPADIECLRSSIEALIMMKLGRNGDLRAFLRDVLGYRDGAIWNHLCAERPRPAEFSEPLKTPYQPQIWAMLITSALLRGECNCYERYTGADGYSQKYVAMNEACNKNHNLASLLDEHGTYADPINWLHRAVHGHSDLSRQQGGHFRAFGNSMLCAVFTTPSGAGLYLNRDDLLVEDRPWLLDFQDKPTIGRRVTGGDVDHVAVWACLHCKSIVGQNGSPCRSPKCHWKLIAMPRDELTLADETLYALVNWHPGRHVWPRRGIECPICGKQAVDRKKIPISRPLDISFDELPI